MNISTYLTAFAERKNNRYKPYSKIYRQILLGGKPYSLNTQKGFEESGYLHLTIRSCVQRYSSNKDTAILLFKDLAAYLTERGVNVPEIHWPPIPVSNTFERLMFMAKYLQEENHKISDLRGGSGPAARPGGSDPGMREKVLYRGFRTARRQDHLRVHRASDLPGRKSDADPYHAQGT